MQDPSSREDNEICFLYFLVSMLISRLFLKIGMTQQAFEFSLFFLLGTRLKLLLCQEEIIKNEDILCLLQFESHFSLFKIN